ncbi:MAG: non-canonical purine NTP pyrophosphatase [Puniceicoccales bacterium]|jgi:XTP/dITP diphosphohydrolase|nr:non-canonical purine NTP pyrophosphatase [Puniceicoccales bacterium]
MKKLCIASTNKGKIWELKSLLDGVFELYLLEDFGALPEAEEPFESFLKNAKNKAKHYAKFTGMPTFSEDAGLCVRALNLFPGVRSKRFIAESGGEQNAFARLENMLAAKDDRRAEFVCVSVIFDPQSGQIFTGKGAMQGEIRFPAQGASGFGFDPIFTPVGYQQTIAELGETVKSAIGHRGKSVRALLKNYREKMSS